jgi:hypothetical protein
MEKQEKGIKNPGNFMLATHKKSVFQHAKATGIQSVR